MHISRNLPPNLTRWWRRSGTFCTSTTKRVGTPQKQRAIPLFSRSPNRWRPRISAENAMSSADNFLQKQQKQQTTGNIASPPVCASCQFLEVLDRLVSRQGGPGVDFRLTEEQRHLQQRCRELAIDFAIRSAEHDRDASHPIENYRRLRDEGFLALTVARKWGGAGGNFPVP